MFTNLQITNTIRVCKGLRWIYLSGRAFVHGVVGHWIDPTWFSSVQEVLRVHSEQAVVAHAYPHGGPIQLFLIPAIAPKHD